MHSSTTAFKVARFPRAFSTFTLKRTEATQAEGKRPHRQKGPSLGKDSVISQIVALCPAMLRTGLCWPRLLIKFCFALLLTRHLQHYIIFQILVYKIKITFGSW